MFNASIMRGFDYYDGIVFEYKDASGEVTQSLGGGGRYDKLIGNLGGRQMTAVGFAIGMDRILEGSNSPNPPNTPTQGSSSPTSRRTTKGMRSSRQTG